MTQVCRVCGCSNFSACAGGCWWVDDDLCSSCDDPTATAMAKLERDLDEDLGRVGELEP